MTYLWINPVSERMVSEQALKRILTEHQLTQVRCREDWGAMVLEKYKERMEQANGTVADARCPEAVNLIERYNEEENLSIQVADIEPILIHCARELSARSDLADGGKIITTPCRILAEKGNALELPRTRFVSWKDFLSELGETLESAPEASPIPPGFFTGLSVPVLSLSGQEAIEAYLQNAAMSEAQKTADRMMAGIAGVGNQDTESGERKLKEDTAGTERSPLLLELLYCRQGCHMGDGVR